MHLTHGRFSGATRGPMVGHVAPEAVVVGPIAGLEDDDDISMNIPDRTLTIDLTDAELKARFDDWECPESTYTSGGLKKNSRNFDSAERGAVINPLLTRE